MPLLLGKKGMAVSKQSRQKQSCLLSTVGVQVALNISRRLKQVCGEIAVRKTHNDKMKPKKR